MNSNDSKRNYHKLPFVKIARNLTITYYVIKSIGEDCSISAANDIIIKRTQGEDKTENKIIVLGQS